MKIGILGSSDVSRKLADGFIELGHTVKIGTRDPSQEKIVEWIANHKGGKVENTSATTTTVVSAGSFAEAALFGELNVLATSWDGASNAIIWLIRRILLEKF